MIKVGDTVFARYLLNRGTTFPITQGTPLLVREIMKFRATRHKDRFGGWVKTPATRRIEVLTPNGLPYWVNEDDVVTTLADLL